MHRESLAFFESVLSLDVDEQVDIGEAVGFLSSHFAWTDIAAPSPFAHLRVRPIDVDDARFAGSNGGWEEIHVRESAAEFFSIPARRRQENAIELVECTKTGTRFVFDRDARSIEVQLGAAGQLDVVEVVRDLVLKDQENRGVLPVHATVAWRPGSCVLVIGRKGSGKTTILLELVEHCGYKVLSGDRALLRFTDDRDLAVAGWPDYPHLGYATVVKYRGLASIAGLADGDPAPPDHAFSAIGKYAVDPARFRERFACAPAGIVCRPSLVLRPNIGPGDRTLLSPDPGSREARARELAEDIESAFAGPHAGWHTFSDDRTAQHRATRERLLWLLAGVPALRLSGPGDLRGSGFEEVAARVIGG